MSRSFGGTRNATVLILVLAAILVPLAIWLLGPSLYIGGVTPLADPGARLLVIVIAYALLLITLGAAAVGRRQQDRDMLSALTDVAPRSASPRREASLAMPRRRSNRASRTGSARPVQEVDSVLALLRQNRFGGGPRRGIYQLPWYAVIGPRSAGKSAVVDQLGLMKAFDGMPSAAEGGWRWLLAEEAVLLDLDGRFTVCDRQPEIDRAAWLGLLGHLRRRRRRRPLDGIILVLSLPDLMTRTERQRADLARILRQRLHEAGDTLRQALPTYVVLTQADRILGFREYFRGFDTGERKAVWGYTFPAEPAHAAHLRRGLGEAFAGLIHRLEAHILDRVQRDEDPLRRGRSFAFPRQIATLAPIVSDFLQTIFQTSRFAHTAWLRGFYLASAQQKGTAHDVTLTRTLGRFGIPPATPIDDVESSRSFFLAGLFDGVILPERGLGARKVAPMGAVAWIAGTAIGVAAVAYLVLAFVVAEQSEQQSAKLGEEAVAQYRHDLQGVDLAAVSNPDPRPIAPALAVLGSLPRQLEALPNGRPPLQPFAPGRKIATTATAAYRVQLDRLLLPRMILRVEAAMRTHIASANSLRALLPIYLGIGGRKPLDKAVVQRWFATQWSADFPKPQDTALRAQLDADLRALLDRPFAPPPLDRPLVNLARKTLDTASPAQHAARAPAGRDHAL